MTLEIEDGSEHAKKECDELRRIDPNLKDKVITNVQLYIILISWLAIMWYIYTNSICFISVTDWRNMGYSWHSKNKGKGKGEDEEEQ